MMDAARRAEVMRRLRDALVDRNGEPDRSRTTKALARHCGLGIDEARRALITMDSDGDILGVLGKVDGRTCRIWRWRG